MADILAKLPGGFSYVYQFQNGKSQYRCVAAVLAMVAEFAYPGKWQSPTALMGQIYERYAGPDIPGNTNGMTKEECYDWLSTNHIGYLDRRNLIGNANELHNELTSENKQDVIQLITVSDEGALHYARNGQKLHNWVDTGLHHCILRVGYSDSAGYGLYMEPAAGLAFPHPVPILWDDIEKAGILTCLSIMPPGVKPPPAGFSYQHGTWPIVRPPVNVDKAQNTIAAMMTAMDALKAAMSNLGNDLSTLKTEEAQEEAKEV